MKGDTRVDEVMLVIDCLFWEKLGKQRRTYVPKEMELLHERILELYYDLGFATGVLKRLMRDQDMTWTPI